jgi:hypothetical protein
MMGYNGWGSLFDYSTKKGQPSITYVSSMFSLGVIVVAHFILSAAGTKKRARRLTNVMRHTATEEAFAKSRLDKLKPDPQKWREILP